MLLSNLWLLHLKNQSACLQRGFVWDSSVIFCAYDLLNILTLSLLIVCKDLHDLGWDSAAPDLFWRRDLVLRCCLITQMAAVQAVSIRSVYYLTSVWDPEFLSWIFYKLWSSLKSKIPFSCSILNYLLPSKVLENFVWRSCIGT